MAILEIRLKLIFKIVVHGKEAKAKIRNTIENLEKHNLEFLE